MPVSITDNNNQENFLIPAPFVNINKTFDKQGDGEILGSRYSIQLKGYIVADRGSPKGDGSFLTTRADVVVVGLSADDWYEQLQNKQKALSNLISKLQSGAFLQVYPIDGAVTGFEAHVRLESVDLPTHNPGDPYKAEYTINLSSDYIEGPQGTPVDEDDWSTKNKWLISSSSENWSIQESDKHVLERESNNVKLSNSRKVFELTRTTSATGKNKFDRNDKADGLEPVDGFTQKYDKNGRAWQQARGYIYDIVKYGHQFLFGRDDTEYTGALPVGAVTLAEDPDDYHLFAMNLPVPNNASGPDPEYKAYNYKRSQTVDVKGGSFSVTETWLLLPNAYFAGNSLVTETMEFTTQEDPTDGTVTVTVNGSIEGLVDNADTIGVGNANNKDKDPERNEPVDEVFNYDGEAAGSSSLLKSKYTNAVDHYKIVITSLFDTAKHIINDLSDYSQLSVNPVPTSKTVTQQPGNGIITYSVSFETTNSGNTGSFIPYARKEELSVSDTYPGQLYAEHVVVGRRLGPVIQDVGTQTHWLREVSISCNVDVNRRHLCVSDDDEVMPYDTEKLCIAADNSDETSGTCSNDTYTTKTSCVEATDGATPPVSLGLVWTPTKLTWIFNPNFISLGTSNPRPSANGSLNAGTLFTSDIITAKPGAAPTSVVGGGNPDDFNTAFANSKEGSKRKQYVAIKKLLNSLDPLTYLHADFGGMITNTASSGGVTKRFTNAPQESWNPKTGAWSYSISWVYEIDDPYTTATSLFFDGAFNDKLYLPDRQDNINELPRTAPGQES